MDSKEKPIQEDTEELPLSVDPAILNKSAKEFSESITSGDLYKGLKGEDKGE